ncbi:MAG: hypothetical protein HYZ51_03730 [Candidatus Doudnabacteria bacterium]|nr:hypothetical protein [Candidatus Doudnabacteria bacterium]
MDTDKKRINLEDLTEAQKAELLADQVLEKQPRSDSPLRELKPHTPPAFEGGGRPTEVSLKTHQGISNLNDGQIDPAILEVPTSNVAGSLEAQAFKHLEEGAPFKDGKGGAGYAHALTDFLQSLGDKKKE